MPCTYMENTQTCMHMLTHNHIRSPVHAHICTHRGTSVQRTPSILNPDPGLHAVFTWKCSTTICGPSRLLCTSSRLGLGKRAASQMGRRRGRTTSDGLPCLRSQTLRREGKRGREEAALPGSHRNSRDSHIPWKWSMVRASSLTGRAEEKRRSKEKGLPVWEGDHNRSVLRGELISLET